MRKAFLLGAGLGTRLRPLTDRLPKPLIPVFHEPLIHHALDHCLANGLDDFAINTHHLPEAWSAAFPDSRYRGAPLAFFHEPVLLETGGGIKNIEPWINNEPILVYNGDIHTNLPLQKLLHAHQRSGNRATLALRSPHPVPTPDQNINVAVEGDRIIDMRHARGIHPGTHQFTGIYCIEADVLARIPAGEKISIVPAFLELAAEGSLGAAVIDEGTWLDLGNRKSYLEAHGLANSELTALPPDAISDEAEIHPNAIVMNSVIGPGCKIGPNSLVSNSLLWPHTTVAPDARLTNCILYSTNPATGTHENADL
jgi:mannose-1-phosphate guanylyltransferase